MNEKVALVTGAASGIGLAVAQSLASQGFKVLVSDMQMAAAQLAAEQIVADGGKAKALQLDITQQQHIDDLVEYLAGEGEELSVLINNAGLQHVSRIEEFPIDKWRLLNEVLLVGPAMLTRAILPSMRRNDFGRIVNIGSIHALVASPYKSAYVAAKHGVLGFSKVIALETAEQDITINTICPSYVKTPLMEKQISDQANEHGITEQEVIDNIMLLPMPKKSFIALEEITAAVDYLVGGAARNMTGQTLVLDGGWTSR